jgi:hypothetical protein
MRAAGGVNQAFTMKINRALTIKISVPLTENVPSSFASATESATTVR